MIIQSYIIIFYKYLIILLYYKINNKFLFTFIFIILKKFFSKFLLELTKKFESYNNKTIDHKLLLSKLFL